MPFLPALRVLAALSLANMALPAHGETGLMASCARPLQPIRAALFNVVDRAQALLRFTRDDLSYLRKILDEPSAPEEETMTHSQVLDWLSQGRGHLPGQFKNSNLVWDELGWVTHAHTVTHHLALENGDAPLTHIRAQLDPSRDLESKNGALFEDILTLMEAMPELRAWIHVKREKLSRARRDIDWLPPSIRERIILVPLKTELPLWSQDTSKPLAAEQGGLPTTLLPREPRIVGFDAGVLELRRRGQIDAIRFDMKFEGGDIVVGARHVLVGEKLMRENMESMRITRQNVLELLETAFGKPVLEITAPSVTEDIGRAPLSYHIDLSVAVARNHNDGKEVVLLNSTRLLMKLLLDVTDFENLTTQDFHARIAARNPTSDEEVEMLHNLRTIPLERLKLQQARLDYVAQRVLVPAGYSIIPVPGVNAPGETKDRSYYRSYTNAIFSRNLVAMPRLDVPVLDDYSTGVLQSMGYRVLPMGSARLLYHLEGGPRCALETYRAP